MVILLCFGPINTVLAILMNFSKPILHKKFNNGSKTSTISGRRMPLLVVNLILLMINLSNLTLKVYKLE